MTPATMRMIGVAFMLSAAILLILNLRRVANLRSFWVVIPLFVIGLIFLTRSKPKYR